jgi:hypothetical protein
VFPQADGCPQQGGQLFPPLQRLYTFVVLFSCMQADGYGFSAVECNVACMRRGRGTFIANALPMNVSNVNVNLSEQLDVYEW